MLKTNSEQFLSEFKKIELLLKKRYGSVSDKATFRQVIDKASERDKTINYFAIDIKEFYELRNAIVHKSDPSISGAIAEPHTVIVERVHKIRTLIERPPNVSNVMTSPVVTASTKDSILDVALRMKRHILTHVPVYTPSGSFVGVLSETSLLRRIQYTIVHNTQIDTSRTIGEMKEQLDKSGDKFNDYLFIPMHTSVLEAKHKFETALKEGRRLGALFVTKTGKRSEPILGIITAWDIPKLEI